MAKKKEKSKEKGEEGGSGKKKKIIIGVVALAGIYKFVLAPKPEPADEALAAGVTTLPPEGEILPVPEMTLNLLPAEGDEETHFVRVGIALVLEEGALASEVELEQARALDVAVDVLSSYTYQEAMQADFKQEVKEELSEKTREAFGGETVLRVIFTSFVVD